MSVTAKVLEGGKTVAPHEPIILVDLSKVSEEKWLNIRKGYIGASEVSAVLGVNQWKSPLSLYLEKIGAVDGQVENEHIEFGKQMEAPIREWFPKKFEKAEGVKIEVQPCPYMFGHPVHKFLAASPDGVMEHPEHGDGGIEIKTASEYMWREWEEDNLPDAYYVQVQAQMLVTGWSYVYIVALVGKKLLWKLIPRNDEIINIIVDRCFDFWHNNVLAKVPPAPIGVGSDFDALKALYPAEDPGKTVELHEKQELYDEYKELAAQVKELTAKQDAIKQVFQAEMGDAETAYVGKKKATWKIQERKGYTVQPSSSRVFRIW